MTHLAPPTALTFTRHSTPVRGPKLADEPEALVTRAWGMHNAVWMLMLSALAARLAAILLRGDWGSAAAGEFGSLGAGLLEGSGFAFNEAALYTQHGLYEPSSAQPPTYPLLLAGLYWLFGAKASAAHVAALLVNAVLGAATVPIAYNGIRRVGGTHAVGVCAAALLAFWPTQLFAVTLVHPLTLVTLLVVLSVALYYLSLETHRVMSWIGFSVVTSLAALTEPTLLPALGLALILVLGSKLPRSLRVRNGLLLVVCALALIGPWTFRNWRVHGTIQPVTATFWSSVWKGNNPHSAGTDRPALTSQQRDRYWSGGQDDLRQFDLLTDAQRQQLDGKRTAEREAMWREWSLDYIRQNPLRYAQLCGVRLARTAWAEWDDPRSHDPFYVYFTTRSLLLLGALAGLVLAWRQGWQVGWPLAIAASILLSCTLTVTAARCALPLEPFQIALVCLLMVSAWQGMTGTKERPPLVRRFAGGANDGSSPASLGLGDEPWPR